MRLEISRRADLAVRALLAVATGTDRTKAEELAHQLDTTAGFVPQIVGPLVKRGWLRSDARRPRALAGGGPPVGARGLGSHARTGAARTPRRAFTRRERARGRRVPRIPRAHAVEGRAGRPVPASRPRSRSARAALRRR